MTTPSTFLDFLIDRVASGLASGARSADPALDLVPDAVFPDGGTLPQLLAGGLPSSAALQLATNGYVSEEPSGGRRVTHLLLSGFPVGGSELQPIHLVLLNLLHLPKLGNPSFRIEQIVGGASQSGPEAGTATSPGNEVLAQERAAQVASWLVFKLGLSADEVQSRSFGSRRPLIDKSSDPSALEEPLNRNVIVTFSTRIVELPEPAPPPRPADASPGAEWWGLSTVGELGLDLTIPALGVIGVGGGVAVRWCKVQRLSAFDVSAVVEERDYIAIGGGAVADVDPLLFGKDVAKAVEAVTGLIQLIKSADRTASVGYSVLSFSVPLAHWLPLIRRETLTFEDFNPSLVLTENISGVTAVVVSGEVATLPLVMRKGVSAGVDISVSGIVPGAAVKQFKWVMVPLD